MERLTFITGNSGKVAQLAKYLNYPVNHQRLDLIEVQSVDLQEVIEHKVKEAYQQIHQPVIVDDTALTIDAMGKLPGPFIKFFLKEMGVEKICTMASCFSDQSATAEVAIGMYDGKQLETFIGTIKGSIAKEPKGKNGFGWDQIFIPKGFTKTRGEMEKAEYDLTSPRRLALEKLKGFLEKGSEEILHSTSFHSE